jgi:hypothetical protein
MIFNAPRVILATRYLARKYFSHVIRADFSAQEIIGDVVAVLRLFRMSRA